MSTSASVLKGARTRNPLEQYRNREDTKTILLKNCQSGLGIKICGGQAEDGSYTGIFIKKILIGGVAGNDGRLQEGDHILEANGQSLLHASNEQAVTVLRNGAQSNNVKLLISRSPESREKYSELQQSSQDLNFPSSSSYRESNYRLNSNLSRSSSLSSRASSTSSPKLEKRSWVFSGGHMSPASRQGSLSRGSSVERPELVRASAIDFTETSSNASKSPRDQNGNFYVQPSQPTSKSKLHIGDAERSPSQSTVDSGVPPSSLFPSPENSENGIGDLNHATTISVPTNTNLGISIYGGNNRPEGPFVYIKDIVEGCDAYRDGRLKKGDLIVSINGESFTGITYEQARSILMRLKLKKGLPMYHVSFVRNPKEALQVPDVQSSSSQQSSAHERLMEPEPSTQSYPQVTSSEHSALKEKLAQLTQSEPGTENEEALLNELMEMVAKDDEESTSYSNLKMPSPPSTRGEVSPSSNVHLTMRQASPDGRNVSLFEPGVSSTPNMDAHDGHIEQYTPASPYSQSIPHYLQQDLEDREQSGSSSPSSASKSSTASRRSRSRRLSLDPATRIKIEKLEVALNYLGFEPSQDQLRALRQRLRTDQNGTVSYGVPLQRIEELNTELNENRRIDKSRQILMMELTDFVHAARNVLNLNLSDRSRSLNASSLQFAMRDIEAIERSQYEQLQQQQQQQQQLQQQRSEQLLNLERNISQEEMERLRRERDEALKEVQFLRQRLQDSDKSSVDLENQLSRTKEEIASAHKGSNELRTRTALLSAALKVAKNKEQNYEDTIRRLENDLDNTKSSKQQGPSQREFSELQKRLVVLGCQLRKAEVSKRTYEVAVDKLTKFAETVHDTLENGHGFITPGSSRKNSKSSRKSDSNNNNSRSKVASDLAQEARDTVKAVKILLEEEPLPFGWEEVYSPDGTRYYINHVTQTTSWLHPVSGVQHMPRIAEDEAPPADQRL